MLGDLLVEQGQHARGRCIALELAAEAARASGDVERAGALEHESAALQRDEREVLLGAEVVALERERPRGHDQHYLALRLRRGFVDHARIVLNTAPTSSGASEAEVMAPLSTLLASEAAELMRALEVHLFDDVFAEASVPLVIERVAAAPRRALRTIDMLLFDNLPVERGANAPHAFEPETPDIEALYAAVPRLKRLDCSWYDGRALLVPPSLDPRFV
ncbi:MAG: hypothetical protein KC503_39955 [Myxococcales bacterium]|nr:hypothetical protein [Myxococcales bacterium]